MLRRIALALVALLLGAALVGGPASADAPPVRGTATCLRSEGAVEAVRAGRARPLAEIRRTIEGELLRADLCRDRDRLVYSITLLDRRGRVRHIDVDAVTGGIRYDGR